MAVSERATKISAARRISLGGARATRRIALAAVALGIVALCAVFHLWRLVLAPGWDPQEGYNLDIAWNLAHGHARLFALESAFAQHPPLFYVQLAVFIHLFGYSVAAVRALAGVYAVFTCATLVALGRRLVGTSAALWAGILFTAAPLMLDNTRWGYSYTQLAFVGLLCLWAVWHHDTTGDARWLAVAAMLAGVAAFSDYTGIAWVAFVALVALRRSWRSALLALGLGLGVLALGLLVCFAIAPGGFAGDVAATLGRAGGGNPLAQVIELLLNYYRFLSFDPVMLLGVVGLFLVREPRARGLLLGAFALLALVSLKVRPLGASFHTAVPLLPLLALGAGVAADRALRQLYAWALEWLDGWRLKSHLMAMGQDARPRTSMPVREGEPQPQSIERKDHVPAMGARLAAALVVFLVVVSPVGMALATDAAGIGTTLPTRQDAILATPADADAVFGYVLTHARGGDLVLATPELAWRFDAPADAPRLEGADILQTVAQSGRAVAFYPAGLPAARWAFRVSLDRARFVIVDDLTRQLATPDEEPALVPVLAAVERWPVIFRRGQYTIYERPGT